MSWTEIVFWLLARLRPLLWYYHRLGWLLEVAAFAVADEGYLRWLAENEEGRADFESKVADGEYVLDVVIGLRAREILGLPGLPDDRPGIARCARIHSAPTLEHLVSRLARLIARSNDAERLSRLRASCIRRLMSAAPVLLEADHRPMVEPNHVTTATLSPLSPAPPAIFANAAALAGLRIRAPP